MLTIEALDAFYGESHILHGIEITIPTRGRVAVIGRNGAGKSTLLKSIMNAGCATRGRIRWNDTDLNAQATHQRARLGLVYVPEDRRILAELTVLENLKMAAGGVPSRQRRETPQRALERFPMLVPIRDRLGGLLSGGQQQILAVARAALSHPRLLLLDEATEGLAPVIVEALVQDVIGVCEREESGLLICEQNVWFARQCTQFVYVLDSGRIVFGGTWAEFDARPEIKARHLAV